MPNPLLRGELGGGGVPVDQRIANLRRAREAKEQLRGGPTVTFGQPPAAQAQADRQFRGDPIPRGAMVGGPPNMPTWEDIMRGVPGQQGSANAGMSGMADAQRRAAQSIGALEAQYEARKAELAGQYQLTETPEERASIQHLLAVIEAQREAGTKVIERVYGQAIEDAAVRSDEVREAGVEAGARTAETFQDAASDTAEMFGQLRKDFGGPMGAGAEALSPVAEGAIADMQRQAAIEQAFDERMFGVTADDIGFLGEAMRPEMGAQVGGLQRIAAQTSAAAQAQYDMEVQRRIAAERIAKAQALQQLGMMFDQRRFGLEDQQIALMAQQAQMQQSAAQASNQLSPQQQFAMEQAQAKFAQEMQDYQMRQQQSALRGLGGNPLAAQLGIAPEVGMHILTPSAQEQMMRSQMMR